MNASKENARAAVRKAETLLLHHSGADLKFIQEFLAAAEKKLPTEESYRKDRERRKKPTAAK